MSPRQYKYLGSVLHDLLFFEWAYCATESERPPVSIPEEDLVGNMHGL